MLQLVVHSHRHGEDIFIVEHDTELSEAEAVKAFDLNYEPELEEEIYIELVELYTINSEGIAELA